MQTGRRDQPCLRMCAILFGFCSDGSDHEDIHRGSGTARRFECPVKALGGGRLDVQVARVLGAMKAEANRMVRRTLRCIMVEAREGEKKGGGGEIV